MWTRLCNAVNEDTVAGIVASTRTTRERYWRHWEKFIPRGFDPYLQDVDRTKQIALLQLFARWVREGAAGRGRQVKTGSIQAALGAIGKTIELAGFDNPLHRTGTNIYHAAIAMQTETYRRTDPVVKKQLAVPVTVPNFIFRETRNTSDNRLKAAGELVLIAFYFLLRVGEYTHHGRGARRTQQFRIKDIKCFVGNDLIPMDQVQVNANKIDLVSLTIDNQNNGV